ncbi:MAG: hypothetical protein SGJ05_04185 [bacterium]|nr:hypothetical protein [bacterium]
MTTEEMAQLFVASVLAGDIETVLRLINELMARIRALEGRIRMMESRVVTATNGDRDRGTRADLLKRYGKPLR